MMKKRVVLWWMLFIGIIVHMFQKTNINIAIISMVKPKIAHNELISDEGICGSNILTFSEDSSLSSSTKNNLTYYDVDVQNHTQAELNQCFDDKRCNKMQKRYVLCWLILTLLVCNTFVTLNINIAIVSMVKSHSDVEVASLMSPSIICPNTTYFLRDYLEENVIKSAATSNIISDETRYDWSEAEQNMVLSGYYWLNYVSIMPGGILSHKYGSKIVIGIAQFISSVMSSLIPVAAGAGYGPVTISWIRAVQGFLSFMSVPAGLFSIIGNWCPPDERAKFGATFPIGSTIGMTLGSILFGYIGQYLHWTLIFHFTSVCGIVWSVFWYYLAYDSPTQHPTITIEEKTYIEDSLKDATSRTKTCIPWKGIITSVPFLISILATASFMWAWVVITTYSPKYLKLFYGMTSNEIGIITGVPNFVVGILPFGIAYYSDLVIRKKLLSMTAVRKICTFLGGILSMISLLIMAFTKCHLTLIVFCLMVNFVLRSFTMFGAPLVIMDMSPKFCGILEGFSGTISAILTFVFSTMLNYFATTYDIEWLWKMVFLYTALFGIFASGLFLIFGTSKVQHWNFNDDAEKDAKLIETPDKGINSQF